MEGPQTLETYFRQQSILPGVRQDREKRTLPLEHQVHTTLKQVSNARNSFGQVFQNTRKLDSDIDIWDTSVQDARKKLPEDPRRLTSEEAIALDSWR